MAAAGDCSLLIAETADEYDRCSGVMCKKGLIKYNIEKVEQEQSYPTDEIFWEALYRPCR